MNQLNFSEMPHIIAEENTEELQKRSQAIIKIRELMDGLTAALSSYVDDIKQFDSKNNLLNKRETALKEAEYDLSQKEKQVYALQDSVKQEREYVINTTLSLTERENKIKQDKDYLEDIERAKLEFEDKKAELVLQEQVIDKKTKSLEQLNEIMEKIEEDQALLNKSAQVDAERKRLLDLREERIRAKEQRLRLDQEE